MYQMRASSSLSAERNASLRAGSSGGCWSASGFGSAVCGQVHRFGSTPCSHFGIGVCFAITLLWTSVSLAEDSAERATPAEESHRTLRYNATPADSSGEPRGMGAPGQPDVR